MTLGANVNMSSLSYPRTFYFAGPSALRSEMRILGIKLQHLGLEWVGGWDWTDFHPPDHEDENPKKKRLATAGMVLGDLICAQGADLFILFCSREHPSLGGHVELGARLGVSRRAFVVLNGCDHVFYDHPLIERAKDWSSMLLILNP
jgi:hypothetical protein